MPEGTATPVAPAAPAAPASPAPAAPTPAPAPATPATPTPAAPETPVTPAAPETPATPAAPAITTHPEPKQEDFPGDVQGFLEAHNAWERGDETEQPSTDGQENVQTETTPEAEQTTEEQDQPQAQPEKQDVTPEALNEIINGNEQFKAVLEATPEIKNKLFQMARQNAKAQGVLKYIPNEESAAFAAETANKFVTHRMNFMAGLDNPEQMPTAFESFREEFREMDDKGAPAVDSDGDPVYGDDFYAFADYTANLREESDMGELESVIAAGQFPTDDAREAADMALQAFKYIKEWRAGRSKEETPNFDGLSPEAKSYLERERAAINAEKEKLGLKQKEQTAAERKANRETYETDVRRKIGGSVGSRLKNLVGEDEKNGVFIPSYVTETKDPKTGISMFAQTLLHKFQEATFGRVDENGKVIGGVAHIRNKMNMLANRPPSEQAAQARLDYVNELIDEHLPGIYEEEKRSVTSRELADRARRQGNHDKRKELTTPEPRGGSAVTPKSMDVKTAFAEAIKQVRIDNPGISDWEANAKALVLKDEFVSGRR